MGNTRRKSMLMFAVTALAAMVVAAVHPSHASLSKRMDAGAGTSGGSTGVSLEQVNHGVVRLSYNDLQSGKFQQSPGFPPSHSSTQYSFYGDKYFYRGKPIFNFRDEGRRIEAWKLRQAVSDFGGFHARLHDPPRVLTIGPHPDHPGHYVPWADHSVVEHIERIDQTGRTFGRNAALIANGWNARTLPPRRTFFGKEKPAKGPLDWGKIHEVTPANPNADLKTLKRKLDDNRFIRFINSQGDRSLGIRAFPDGRIEHDLKVLVRGTAHF